MFKLRYLLFILFVTGCDDVRIVAPPSTSPNFSPIGDSVQCNACGQRALELCQASDPESYPQWFGFSGSGSCLAYCSHSPSTQQDIATISGPRGTACPYQVNTTLNFKGEVCPSGIPERGDRDFWGHGPRFVATVTAAPNSTGTKAVGQIEATWAETQSDFSTITLPLTTIAESNVLTRSSWGSSQEIEVTGVSPSTSRDTNIVMSSRQQEVISPANGHTLLQQLVIIGDTHADDISIDGNCYDNARIHSATFRPVRVTIEPRP